MRDPDTNSISYVVERDVDLVVVQLLQTSREFRDWFTHQLEFDQPVSEFLCVKHSVMTSNGESDIEVGFRTTFGDDQIVLVENKIDASLQHRQLERYYERGEYYLETGNWDGFKVCLIAPEAYVDGSQNQSLDSVITYEELMDVIRSLEHDGREFFLDVFKESLSRRGPADNSELTSEISRKILSELGESSMVELYQYSNTQVRLESSHEEHPAAVLYNSYIPGKDDGNRAIVRINLTGRNDVPEEERDAYYGIFAEELDVPEGFEQKNRPMDVVKKEIFRSDFDSREEYIDSIVSALRELVEYYHPKVVQDVSTNDS